MFLIFTTRVNKPNVIRVAVNSSKTLISLKQRDWSGTFCLQEGKKGARRTIQKALGVLSCAFRQSHGLMFRLLHLAETPKTGGPGALCFHQTLGFSIPIAMVTLPMNKGQTAGVHCVFCRCLERASFTLIFRLLCLFMSGDTTSSERTNVSFGSFWLVKFSSFKEGNYISVLVWVGRGLWYKRGH